MKQPLPLLGQTPGERPRGQVPRFAKLERLSLELTRACAKGCSFCYNGSSPRGDTQWRVDEVLTLALDCIAHGLKSLSFGGGEPLQYPGIFELLQPLQGHCFRSLTTNGLLLERHLEDLVHARPDKVHVSVHFPDDQREVSRVSRQLQQLHTRGIPSGVNLLVRRSGLEAARAARLRLESAGLSLERILFLPMRGHDCPTPQQVAWVAGAPRFQSVTCLAACAASHRFASLGWDRTVAWCSYTRSRRPLSALSHQGLVLALQGLELENCSVPI